MRISTFKIKSAFIVIFTITSFLVNGQSYFRFTHWMYNELALNPAYAGSKNGIAMNAIYRNQWVGFEGSPKTQMFSIHSPTRNPKIGLGGLIAKESIGVNKDVSLYLNYAYHIRFNSLSLSFGLAGGLTNKQISWNDLEDTEPYGLNRNDPAIADANVSTWVPNFSFGTYLYNDKFFFSASVPRLLTNEIPNNNSIGDAFTMYFDNVHLLLAAGYVFKLKNNIVVKPTILNKRVKGVPKQWDLIVNAYLNKGVMVGAGIHSYDSFLFMLGKTFAENIYLGYSFDITFSMLSSYNSGTHEFVLSYNISSRKDIYISPRYF